jgi:catechol 2,3-dioxygenase-like lactoylglutathione lyase family enzyme
MANAKPQLTWDHVHIRTPDPEATARWFADMLGAEIVPSPARIDVRLGGNSIFLTPVSAGDGINPAPVTPYQGLDHFGLAVQGLDALVADLKAKGVQFSEDVRQVRPGLRVCFIPGRTAFRSSCWSGLNLSAIASLNWMN